MNSDELVALRKALMKTSFWVVLVLSLGLSSWAGAQSGIPSMSGSKVWVLGINYPWVNFGNDFTDDGYNNAVVEKDFDAMAASGVKVARWWLFPELHPAPLWTSHDKGALCTGLPPHWVDHMVEAANYAHSKGIQIYFCFLSFDIGRKKNKENHDDIITNAAVQKSFFEKAVKPIVEALGQNPGVMGWDIINEPEWIIRKEDTGDAHPENEEFSLAQMRGLVGNFVKTIRPYVKQPISVGSACMKWCGKDKDFWSGLGLDFFDIHYYDWMTKWYDPTQIPVSMLNFHTDNGKPVILGECMGNPVTEYTGINKPLNHYQMAVSLYQNGYAGYLPWSWNSDDHIKNNPAIIAEDFSKFLMNNMKK
jgi:hypothetical protein